MYAHHELERPDAQHPITFGERTHIAVEHRERGLAFAALERHGGQLRQHLPTQRMLAEGHDEGLSLLEPALAYSQLSQSQHRLVGKRRQVGREQARRLEELRLGFLPAALGDEHGAVVSSTHPEHPRHLPALAEASHGTAPLRCAARVAHALARIDQETADPTGHIRARELPAKHGGRGLLNEDHPFLNAALRDERQTLQGKTLHLQIQIPALPAARAGLRTQVAAPRSVDLAQQRKLTLVIADGAARKQRVGPLQQPPRDGKPGPRDTRLAARRGGVAPQPCGGNDGTIHVTALTEETESPLARGKRFIEGAHEPAARRKSVVRLRRLLDRIDRLEPSSPLRPRTATQRIARIAQQSLRRSEPLHLRYAPLLSLRCCPVPIVAA